MQKSKRENNERSNNIKLVTSFSKYNSQIRLRKNRDYEQYF